jgi:hypothetical protein
MKRISLEIVDREGYQTRSLLVMFLSLMLLFILVFIVTVEIPNSGYNNTNIPQVYEDLLEAYKVLLLAMTSGWAITTILISQFIYENIKLGVLIVGVCVWDIISIVAIWFSFHVMPHNHYTTLLFGSIFTVVIALITIMFYTKWRPKPLLIINNDSIVVKQLRKKMPSIQWTSVKEVNFDVIGVKITTDTGTYSILSRELYGRSEEGEKISEEQTVAYLKELCEKKGITCTGV